MECLGYLYSDSNSNWAWACLNVHSTGRYKKTHELAASKQFKYSLNNQERPDKESNCMRVVHNSFTTRTCGGFAPKVVNQFLGASHWSVIYIYTLNLAPEFKGFELKIVEAISESLSWANWLLHASAHTPSARPEGSSRWIPFVTHDCSAQWFWLEMEGHGYGCWVAALALYGVIQCVYTIFYNKIIHIYIYVHIWRGRDCKLQQFYICTC